MLTRTAPQLNRRAVSFKFGDCKPIKHKPMLTFELINKKRRPIKIYAISGIAFGILLLILIAIVGDEIIDSLKIVFMGVSAFLFVIGLFILSYSFKFKNAIGHISFAKEYIEVEFLQKKEVLKIGDIQNIQFKLTGYDGLNKSIIFQGLYDLSYRSGINNFVSILTNNITRKFEFYISNQKDWDGLQVIADNYQDLINSKKTNNT